MTVITKPLTEKKSNKLIEPLVENANVQTGGQNQDVESGDEPRYVILGAKAQRVSTATTVCVFLTALLVMSIGVIGGVYLYRLFARSQMHRYEGWCKIPYNRKNTNDNDMPQHKSLVADSELFEKVDEDAEQMFQNTRAFINQEFELDLVEDNYETINVPDFRDGRKGRFIHDFYTNKTGIVDIDGGRCFIMPLNRQRVLPPRSMFDLINKMQNGYYEVDTEVVRETMRVVFPPIIDFSGIGQFIAKECKDVQTYMLEKETRQRLFKRSAAPKSHFTEFAGQKVSELYIDLDAVEKYEKEHSSP